jgi:hypothetical protein
MVGTRSCLIMKVVKRLYYLFLERTLNSTPDFQLKETL